MQNVYADSKRHQFAETQHRGLARCRFASVCICAVGFVLLMFFLSSHLSAMPPHEAGPSPDNRFADELGELDALITSWVLDSLPHTYTDTKKWNLQAEKQTGLGFRRDPGGLIETYRKRELVNHGEWSKFSATLLDPQDQFQIQIVNPRPLADGRMAFDVHIAASLAIEGRQAKWNRGVQLYSIGAEGSAKVRLIVNCSLATSLDISHLPPDLILDPRIEGAQLRVDEFRLNRVGKLGGEFSQQVAAATRKVLDQKIAEKEKQLVAKLNDKIDQNRHKFRLSPRSAAELKWTPAAKPHLPPPVQNVLNNHPDK